MTQKEFFSSRLILAILGTLGCALFYSLRANLSVTIVAMVNHTSIPSHPKYDFNQSDDDLCYDLNNGDNNNEDQEYDYPPGSLDWSPSFQGVVLGAYYYSYILTQVIGGRIAEKWGAKIVTAIGVCVPAIFNALTPIAAEYHDWAVIVCRVLIGAFHGFIFASLYSLYGQWFPKHERTAAIAALLFGGCIGFGVTTIVSGYLCKYGFANGWPSVFYITSAVHVIWLLLWIFFVYNTPENHPRISDAEIKYIKENVETSNTINKKVPVPWKGILSSPVVWASAVIKITGGFGYFLLMAKLPTYLHDVFNINIESNGLFTAYVNFGLSITNLLAGPFSSIVIKNTRFSTTIIRKAFQTIAILNPAICFILIPTLGCNQTAVVILLVISMFFLGFNSGGDYPIISDYSGDFSGTVFGIVNSIGTSSGFLAPLIVGFILESNNGSINYRWNIVFYISGAVNIFGILIFDLFSSAERQPWAKINYHCNEDGSTEMKELGLHNKVQSE